ncbi:MAG TPA: hypothetical protein VGK56_18685 [Anaerolineales bacterium]
MKPDRAPTIYSFIIRFVVEEGSVAEGSPPAYHGAIRHIQSAEEMNFNEWHEAVEFMRRFVPIEDQNENNR